MESSGGNRRIETFSSHLRPNNVAASSQPTNRPLFHPPGSLCQKEYDYIVVGAGSSGCALSARLAEKLPGKSVLLIDAGGDNRCFRIASPFITCAKLQNSDFDFAYRTTAQSLQQNRRSHWPRGKVLGGSSSINYVLAVRGDARAYDKWENELGCEGWGFKDVEKYFMRLEDYRSERNLPHRGKHGPMAVSDNRDLDYATKGTVDAFVKGGEEVIGCSSEDYNKPYQASCVSPSQTTTRDGKRWDTANAYLFGENGAFKTCPNLSCLTNEHCARVLFRNGADGVPEAYGVEMVSGLLIHARSEVILSAGAVGSPHILLLSGVGPKAHLESKGVRIVADVPGVGRNLKDHLMLAQNYRLKPSVPTFDPANPMDLARSLGPYFLQGQGIFATSWVQAVLFTDSKKYQKPTDAHAIQVHFVPLSGTGDDELMKVNYGLDRAIHEIGSRREGPAVTFLPSLLQPKSVGYIELASNDPRDHPIIEPMYLSHPDDIGVLLEAWNMCKDIATKSSMRHILDGPDIDDSVKFPHDSDEYAIYKIKRDVVTIYHPTSTCKMGPDSDPLAVLDHKTLKVRKVNKLRVVDCSSFPDIPAANTNLPAVMLAERAADMIAFGR